MATKPSKSTVSSKKSSSKKTTSTSGKVVKPKTAAPKAKLVKSKSIPAPKKKAVKAKTSKASSFSLDTQPPINEPVIHHDEISLRAYFIAERRHKMGWPGNSGTDWADAVSQLRAEALEKKLPKR